jgi:hypothetical protein
MNEISRYIMIINVSNIDEVYSLLFDLCKWDMTLELEELLNKVPTYIDILKDDGEYFGLCMAHRYNDVLQVLLDYYTKHKLQGNKESAEYKEAMKDLQVALMIQTGKGCLSDEMEEMLKPYIGEFEPVELILMEYEGKSEDNKKKVYQYLDDCETLNELRKKYVLDEDQPQNDGNGTDMEEEFEESREESDHDFDLSLIASTENSAYGGASNGNTTHSLTEDSHSSDEHTDIYKLSGSDSD